MTPDDFYEWQLDEMKRSKHQLNAAILSLVTSSQPAQATLKWTTEDKLFLTSCGISVRNLD